MVNREGKRVDPHIKEGVKPGRCLGWEGLLGEGGGGRGCRKCE